MAVPLPIPDSVALIVKAFLANDETGRIVLHAAHGRVLAVHLECYRGRTLIGTIEWTLSGGLSCVDMRGAPEVV